MKGIVLPARPAVRCFIPGPLVNPMRGSMRGHWSKHARWARQWRDRTSERIRVERLLHPKVWSALGAPTDHKAVRLHAHVFSRFDSNENLRVAMKPVVDGLQDARIIDNDRDASGHTFEYSQEVARSNRGVWVTIERRTDDGANQNPQA